MRLYLFALNNAIYLKDKIKSQQNTRNKKNISGFFIKLLCLVIILGLKVNIALADGHFLDVEWWKTATFEDVQKEIKAGADVNSKNQYGRTPLIGAVANNSNPVIIKELIKAGADVNHKDKDGYTALMWAVTFNSNPAIIKELIKAGADTSGVLQMPLSPEIRKILLQTAN